jgi:hypothetical protein
MLPKSWIQLENIETNLRFVRLEPEPHRLRIRKKIFSNYKKRTSCIELKRKKTYEIIVLKCR